MIINMSTNTAVMIWKAVENFSEHLKASFSFTKHHFLSYLSGQIGSQWVSKLKNCLLLTFSTITLFWNIVWPYCLLAQTNMILSMSTNTMMMIWRTLGKFFKAFENKLFIRIRPFWSYLSSLSNYSNSFKRVWCE